MQNTTANGKDAKIEETLKQARRQLALDNPSSPYSLHALSLDTSDDEFEWFLAGVVLCLLGGMAEGVTGEQRAQLLEHIVKALNLSEDEEEGEDTILC